MAVSGAGIGLDWRAVGRGAAVFLAVSVPCLVLLNTTHGNDTTGQESILWVLAAIVGVVVAPLAGGAAAGAAQRRAPLSHGAAAVGLPVGTSIVVRIALGAADGSLTLAQLVTFVLFTMVVTGLAIVGAYMAFRFHTRG
jgi:hypothetical protein